MSALEYKGRTVLFKCNQKRCGDRCTWPTCSYTTDIEYAEEPSGEYNVTEVDDLYYIAVPVKRGAKDKHLKEWEAKLP